MMARSAMVFSSSVGIALAAGCAALACSSSTNSASPDAGSDDAGNTANDSAANADGTANFADAGPSDASFPSDVAASDGGSTGPIVLAPASSIGLIAYDSVNVYWTSGAGSDAGTVMSVPKQGGSVKTLAAGQQWPGPVAADTTGVYWLNQYDTVTATQGAVMELLPGTTAPATVLSSAGFSPRFLRVLSGVLYVVATDVDVLAPGTTGKSLGLDLTQAQAFAIDSQSLYWSSAASMMAPATISRAPLGTGPGVVPPVKVLATIGPNDSPPLDVPDGLAVDATNVYFADTRYTDSSQAKQSAASIFRVPLDGDGGAPTLVVSVTTPSEQITALDTDGTNVYFTIAQNLMKVPIAGGTPTTLASVPSPSGFPLGDVKVDATSVYYAGPQGLTRLAK